MPGWGVLRAAGARIQAADMGAHSRHAWAELPERYRHVLSLQGIDEVRCQAIRRTARQGHNGVAYVTPDRIKDLPDAVIDGLIERDLEALQAMGETGRQPKPRRGRGAPQDFTVAGTPRPTWPEAFPNAVVQLGTSLRKMKEHRDYRAAKAGDLDAAARLVADLIRPEVVERIRAQLAGRRPSVVPIFAQEAAGRNKIPHAYAAELAARLGLPASFDIVQTNRTHHTGAGAAARIVRRAEFAGPVEPGRDYLIADDHVTLGGTIADLKAYIESQGGRVILTSTMTASPLSHRLRLDPARLAELRSKLGAAEPWFKERFGHGFEGLTHSEAGYLLSFGSPDTLRRRLAEAALPDEPGGGGGPAGEGGGGPGPLFDPRGGGGSPGGVGPGRGGAAAAGAGAPEGARGDGGGIVEPGSPEDIARARRLEQAVTRLRQRARHGLELDLRGFLAVELAYGRLEVPRSPLAAPERLPPT